MSWMKQSISLATLSFIAVVLFVVLAGPFEMIMGYVENESTDILDESHGNATVWSFTDSARTIFGLVFGFAIFSYIIAIFLNSHENEGEDYMERRLK